MTAAPQVPTSALSLRGLVKSFGQTVVLRTVDLEVAQGEIHALLGENGAGKSTLIKVLAGVHHPDAGRISVHGKDLPPGHGAEDARAAGMAFVHQNLGLIDDLTVADNIALQVGYVRRGRMIDFAKTVATVDELIERVGAKFRANRLVGTLAQDEKVLCAVTRAFAQSARLIVLDEVSASLPAPEMDRLATTLVQSKNNGMAYLFVTHRLSEVFSFADRMTILRDGVVSISTAVDQISSDEAVRHILGASLEDEYTTVAHSPGEPVLTVSGLRAQGLHGDLDLDVRAGEITAVCGLVGSGTRTVARVLGGAQPHTAGTVTVAGKTLTSTSAARLTRAGSAYVPGRRQAEGIFPLLTVQENTFPTRSKLSAWTPLGWSRPSKEASSAGKMCDRFAVKGRLNQAIDELSGGNQQKVVMARTLAHQPRLLILEDPTAGVDVGSRAGIHVAVREIAAGGAGVVLISTDFEEVTLLADRALVMRDGVLAAELVGKDLTMQALAQASHGAYEIHGIDQKDGTNQDNRATENEVEGSISDNDDH